MTLPIASMYVKLIPTILPIYHKNQLYSQIGKYTTRPMDGMARGYIRLVCLRIRHEWLNFY